MHRRSGQKPCWHISLWERSDGLTHPLRCHEPAAIDWTNHTLEGDKHMRNLHLWETLFRQQQQKRPINEVPSTEVLKPSPAEEQISWHCMHMKPLTHNIPNWECYKCSDVPKNRRCQLLVCFWLGEDFSDPLQRNINHIYKPKDMSSLICQATVIYRHLRILTFQSMSSDASAPS